MTRDEEPEQLRHENAALREQAALSSARLTVPVARPATGSHCCRLPPCSGRHPVGPAYHAACALAWKMDKGEE